MPLRSVVVDSCDRAVASAGGDTFLIIQARQLKAVALQDLAQGKDPKRLREAEVELRTALALDPAASYLHFNLGLVLLREGRDADGVAELEEELKVRPAGPQAERARSMIENPRRAREAFAPNFSVVTLDREFVDLASLKGKVVLLDFWGAWCPPCVEEMPSLLQMQQRMTARGVTVLAVSVLVAWLEVRAGIPDKGSGPLVTAATGPLPWPGPATQFTAVATSGGGHL